MIQSLSNFNPIAFLGIDIAGKSPAELNYLQNELKSKIGEYILLKSSENLTVVQLEEITQADEQQMIGILQKYIPDIDSKIPDWLNDFKTEYDKQTGVS